MNLEQIKNAIEWKFKAKKVELVHENSGTKYFKAIDGNFNDAIEVKVHSADGELHSVYTRFAIEGVDIDVTVAGVSDEYQYVGHIEGR